MNAPQSRRRFLNNIGQGVLATSLGPALAAELGFVSNAVAEEPAQKALHFGDMEPLACFLQETPVPNLQSGLAAKIKEGIAPDKLTAPAPLANARTFGGED